MIKSSVKKHIFLCHYDIRISMCEVVAMIMYIFYVKPASCSTLKVNPCNPCNMHLTFFRFSSKGGQSDSQLIVIGSLVAAIPWVTHYAHVSEESCVQSTVDIVKLTHPEKALVPYIELYARLLYRVLNGKSLTDEALNLLSHQKLGGASKRKTVEALLEKAKQYGHFNPPNYWTSGALSFIASLCTSIHMSKIVFNLKTLSNH